MTPSKGSYKFKRRKVAKAEAEEIMDANQISEFRRDEVVPLSHYVERGRKKFDWLKAFEETKKLMDVSSSLDIRLRHTSKSDTSSDSEGEELETKLNAIKLLEKKVDDIPSVKDDVLEPVWQESKNGPKLPSRKKENDKDESFVENTWGSGSPPDPSCGSLLRFVEQFEKEAAAKEQEEVVKFVNGCVVRVKKNRRKRR